MRMSPLSPACRIVTFAPSARLSFSSSASVSASTARGALVRARVARASVLAEPLDVANGEALGDDAVGDRVGSATASRARACPAEIWPGGQEPLRVLRQIGQAQRVGDVAAALADDAGDVGVRIAVVGAELGVARGFFERVEIGALDIFDDGDFERLAVAGLEHDDRDFVLPGPLGGPPAPLAGDDLVGVGDAGDGANQHRLDDAALPDRRGQLLEFGVVEALARIARVRAQELDRRLAGAARERDSLRFVRRGAEQSGEPAPETGPLFGAGGVFRHRFRAPDRCRRSRAHAARHRPSR